MSGTTTADIGRPDLSNISMGETDSEKENARYWVGNHVRDYATRELRPVEALILERYAGELKNGRLLELGCGAGRVTGHLADIAGHVHALDISATMVEYCRWAYPQCSFRRADLRDLDEYDDGLFNSVVATFNVIDVLSHEERQPTLEDWRRVLSPGGLLIVSSHNRGHVPNVPTPSGQVIASLRAGNP